MSASSKKKLRKELNATQMTEKQNKELKEAKKLKTYTIAFVAALILIAVVFLSVQVINWWNRNGFSEKNTIAVTFDGTEMNTVDLNYYFYDAINKEYQNIYSYYSSYTASYYASMGLDLTKTLDKQIYNKTTGETWAAHYLQQAVYNATSDYALYKLSQEDPNFKASANVQSSLSSQSMNLQLYAAFSGLTVDQYLADMYGNGSSLDTYLAYYERSLIAAEYYNMKAEEYMDASSKDLDAISAHLEKNPNDYSKFTYLAYNIKCTSYLKDYSKDKTYTDEEWEAARAAAEKDAVSLGAATDKESLNKLISELLINKDNKDAKATTYTKQTYSSVKSTNEKFAEWLSTKDLAANKIRVFPITTSSEKDAKIEGYTVLMFIERDDNTEKMANIRYLLSAFEGGTKDDKGNVTYSDAEKKAAKNQANANMQKLIEMGINEENFIKLVAEVTESTTENADPGSYLENLNEDSGYDETVYNWTQTEGRTPGDLGVIQVDEGYLLIYYVDDAELNYRDYQIAIDLANEKINKWYTDLVGAVNVITGNTKYVNTDVLHPAANQ